MNQFLNESLVNCEFDKISITVDLVEERDSIVKYRIRVTLNSTEYIVYRDYKNFKSFHKVLNQTFPRLEFSAFPSKFSFLKKKSQRFKGFDKYLKSILEIGIQFPDLAKNNLKRLLGEFLTDTKNNLILSESPTIKDEIVENAQIKSKLGRIMTFMDVKLDEED
jgi:PX domain.